MRLLHNFPGQDPQDRRTEPKTRRTFSAQVLERSFGLASPCIGIPMQGLPFGLFRKGSKSVQVLLNGIAAVMVLTLIISK